MGQQLDIQLDRADLVAAWFTFFTTFHILIRILTSTQLSQGVLFFFSCSSTSHLKTAVGIQSVFIYLSLLGNTFHSCSVQCNSFRFVGYAIE